MIRKTSLAAVALALFAAGAAEAQDPVKWSAEIAQKSVAPGEKVTVVVKAMIDPGWYIYSLTQAKGGPVRSKISLAKEQPFSLVESKVTSTKPKIKFDENFAMEVEFHEKEVTFTVPVQVSSKAGPEVKEIQIRARYQACTNRICLPAQTEKISLRVTVKPKVEMRAASAGKRSAPAAPLIARPR